MEYIVYVDSNNRNQTFWPDSNNYTLHLTTPILNIQEVELVSAQLPDLAASQFVTLDILELRTPQHLTADALTITAQTGQTANSMKNVYTSTSNAFNGSFATIPIKISGAAEFYNANYRISTQYPSRIDKLDRLTISWRQPNNGTLVNCGRNMFLLKFKTVIDPEEQTKRQDSLPPPVPWDSGDRMKLIIIAIISVVGLFIIISVRK
jgi:hypothetical protein